LYGVLKGNKPDFHVAMPPQQAKPFYEAIVQKFSKAYRPDAVKDGLFGAMMQVVSMVFPEGKLLLLFMRMDLSYSIVTVHSV
jgi:D-Tyr-tRNAtyr deacylase